MQKEMQEYVVLRVKEDGAVEQVEPRIAKDALNTPSVLIFVDHERRRVYNYNGSGASVRARFVGARTAVDIKSTTRGPYILTSIDKGQETADFNDFVASLSSGVNQSRELSWVAPRSVTPPTPISDSATMSPRSQARTVTANARSNPGTPGHQGTELSKDVEAIVEQFGNPPDGFGVEATIVGGSVYKPVSATTTIFGRETVQTRLEKIGVDGTFEFDGRIRLIAGKEGVAAIQLLVKQDGVESGTSPKHAGRKTSGKERKRK